MQIRSDLWKELAASGNARMETSVAIGGRAYAPESAVEVSRAIGPSALSVGNCVTATVLFSIRPIKGAEISAGAAAVVKCRFTDGQRESEWAAMGTFYVSRRTDYPTNGLLEFEGYDAMRKADAPYPNLSGFPKAMNSAVSEIARNMGVEVDARTWDGFPTGAEYYVPLPAENEKMIGVLSYIGGVCGGNWVITPQNRLRLVPLASASGAASASDKADVVGILGGITVGESATVTGAVTVSERKEMLEGDDSGAVIRAPSNPYFTRALLGSLAERYEGISYVPFEIQRAIYDPAMEIGDYIVRRTNVSGVSREHIASVVWQESARYGPAFRGDLSAPFLSVAGTQSLSETIDIAGDNYSDLSLRFFKFVNNETVVIGDGESADIINLDFGAGVKQDVIFHAEVKHTAATAETGNATDGWTCTDAVLTVAYYVNDAEVTEYYPVQTETDGKNLLHLQYQWENGRYTIGNFRAALSVSGGSVAIAKGDVRAYIIGQGYTGAYFDTDAAHDLIGILITHLPERYYYSAGERLDFTGLAVKAQYRNMSEEKTVTDQCVYRPSEGEILREEGESLETAEEEIIDATYAENDKPFTTGFPVCLLPENGGLVSVGITGPYIRTYETGGKLNLMGFTVTAYYKNGATKDVTRYSDCVIAVKHADSESYDYVFSLSNPSYDVPLKDGKTAISATYGGMRSNENYVFCGDGDFAWIESPPEKWDYLIGETLDLTGVVVMARENGEEMEVTNSGNCAFNPAHGDLLNLGTTVVNATYKDIRIDDTFSVTCSYGSAERGKLIWARIAELPRKQTYFIDVEGENTLILDGVVVMALFSGGAEVAGNHESDVTADCAFSPGDGSPLEEGFTDVIVTYADVKPMSFPVYCGKKGGDWITDVGLMFIAAEKYKSDYVTGDTLDLSLTDTVVKAYYGNGTEKTVTGECAFFPAHDTLLEEGETVVAVSYAEDGKEYQDKFSVYCRPDGYDIRYIEVIEPPRKTNYYQGDALDLSGLVVGAVQENGHIIVNIKPECRFSPAQGDALTQAGSVTVNVTYAAYQNLYGTFETYFNVDVIAVKARGNGWILLEDGTLIIDGDVDWDELLREIAPYADDIIRIVINDETPITPEILVELIEMLPNLEEIVLPPDVDAEEIQALIASLTVIQIASYPSKSDYVVNETLDYAGLQVTKTPPGGEPQDITDDCVLLPAEGYAATEAGDIVIDVRYEDKSLGTFWVAVAAGKIEELPDKLNYAVGDEIDYTGIEIIEILPDGTERDITADCVFDPPEGAEITGEGPITVTVRHNGEIVAQFEIEAEAEEIIAGGEWWTLYGNGRLDVFCVGDMPNFNTSKSPWYDYRKQITTVAISAGVTRIGYEAFHNCDSLTSVTIPDSVTRIGYEAFQDCDGLTSVTIPDSVTTIRGSAFLFCSRLASVAIPDSVTYIGELAFYSTALKSVTINPNARVIGKAFPDDCVINYY